MLTDANKTKKCAVPLAKMIPENRLICDIYLLINDKYIRFKGEGDFIPTEKYNLFVSKNIKDVYIDEHELENFLRWVGEVKEDEIEDLVREVGEEHREAVELQQEIKEKIFDTFSDQDLSSTNVSMLQSMASQVVESISQKKMPQQILAKLIRHNNGIANHSLNVANLSVFLAMSLGHGHQFVLENIYMGGLFHDYAKSKIPAHLLENPSDVRFSQAINDHPSKGKKLLSKVSGISEQVLTIIEQHHEQFNGKGYPNQLVGDDIYDLAGIVAIANTFENALIDNRGRPKEMHKIAFKILQFDRGKNFNPAVLPRAMEAIRIAINSKGNVKYVDDSVGT